MLIHNIFNVLIEQYQHHTNERIETVRNIRDRSFITPFPYV